MIDANMHVKVEFDEEGRKKIEEAYLTINNIIAALQNVGGHTTQMEDDLDTAKDCLCAILDGTVW